MTVTNKTYYYFHLTRDGWVTTMSEAEIDFKLGGAPDGSLLLFAVTEFSHDSRPDVWHKAEIVSCCDEADRADLKEVFDKFALPNLVEDKCWMQVVQLRAALLEA